MVKCAALNCTNYPGKRSMPRPIKFHRFPKDRKLRQQWIKICGHNINPAQDGICSEHFEDSDYRLKDLLLNVPFKKRHLKEDAVPKLATENRELVEPLEDPLSLHERSTEDRLPETTESKWVLTELVVEPICYRGSLTENENAQNDLLETAQKSMKTGEKAATSAITEPALNMQSKTIKKAGRPGISESTTQTGYLEKSDKAVQTETEYEVALEFRIMYAEAEARKLKTSLKKAIQKRRREQTKEEMLKKIFTPGQLKRLREPDKTFSWSDEDQIAAHELYSAGIRSYNILKERGFPLPGASLQPKWASKAKEKLPPDPETESVPALEPVETELVAAAEPVSQPKTVSVPKPDPKPKSALDTELDVALESILPAEPDLAPKSIKEREIQIFWSQFMSTIE